MAKLELTNRHAIDLRQRKGLLVFAVHNGTRYITPALTIDRGAFGQIALWRPVEVSGKMNGVLVSARVIKVERDIMFVVNGREVGRAPIWKWTSACRAAWGGKLPYEDLSESYSPD